MLKKNVIAIIPAKGNSKRISGKNYKKFDGKPIIAYTIEKLKRSGIFDRIIVSTDSKKIASNIIKNREINKIDTQTLVKIIESSKKYLIPKSNFTLFDSK